MMASTSPQWSAEKKEYASRSECCSRDPPFSISLTVEKNVMFPLNMFTNDTTAEKLKRVNEVLRRVNLVGANKKFPQSLTVA